MVQRLAIVLLCAVVLSGCAILQAANVPGETTASLTLKADILNMINMLDNAQAPGCSHKLVDTKLEGIVGDSVREDWIVESCGKRVVYPVTLNPDPKGGTYFKIQSPPVGARY